MCRRIHEVSKLGGFSASTQTITVLFFLFFPFFLLFLFLFVRIYCLAKDCHKPSYISESLGPILAASKLRRI
jgi:hypothetical protein